MWSRLRWARGGTAFESKKPERKLISIHQYFNIHQHTSLCISKYIHQMYINIYIGKYCGFRMNYATSDIPDICHFFTLTYFEAWKFYTQKCVNSRQKLPRDKQRKFATHIASRQNSVNYTLCVKLHTVCKITHCVLNSHCV